MEVIIIDSISQEWEGIEGLLEAHSNMTGNSPWHVGSHMMGETIPKEANHVRLSPDKKDEWGIPQLITSIDFDDNDIKMRQDFFDQLTEMYTMAGFTNIKTTTSKQAPGLDIHEMGGVRMGNDPKTSVLNKWNQIHTCKKCFCN